MSLHRPAALLAAALVLGATAAPTVAFADDPTTPPTVTHPTATDLRNDLTTAQSAAVAAEKAGWAFDGTDTETGGAAHTAHASYDGTSGSLKETGFGSLIEVGATGSYITVSTLTAGATGSTIHSALNAIARPHATWIFEPDKSLDLVTGDGMTASLSPAGALGTYANPTATLTNTTKTVAPDGSTTTYEFSIEIPKDPGDSGDVTLTTDVDGLLKSVNAVGTTDTSAATYAYGTQPQISLPASSTYVTEKQFTQGVMLAGMASDTKAIAHATAAKATSAAHQHAVSARTIRTLGGSMAKQLNRFYGVKTFATHNVGGGLRITGINPYTHAKAVWTVKAVGKRAVARRG